MPYAHPEVMRQNKRYNSPEVKKQKYKSLKKTKKGLCTSNPEKSGANFRIESCLMNVQQVKETKDDKLEENKEDSESTGEGYPLYGSKIQFRRNRTLSKDCLTNALKHLEFSESELPLKTKKANFQVKGEKIIQNRFYFDKALGRGVQGVVFSAYDTKLQKKVAVKKLINSNKEDLEQHKREIKVLKQLRKQTFEGFLELLDGHLGKVNYIVTELLGDSLAAITTRYGPMKGIRMKHALMISLQVLHRIRDLHSIGYVHGDIKPLNLIFGTGRKKNALNLIDFGLTHKESSYVAEECSRSLYQRENLSLSGTPLFASINLHLGWEKTFKKDDIESWFYLLIYLCKGYLPWSDLPLDGRDNYEQVLKGKINIQIDYLCSNLPKSFIKIYDYCSKLVNGAPIDYKVLEMYLKEAAEEEGFKLLDPEFHQFHWILESKRGTDDKSCFHNKSKHCLSVISAQKHKEKSQNMRFKWIEELVAFKRKNKGQNPSKKAKKGLKGKMKLKNSRGYSSESLKLSNLKNQIKVKAQNFVKSNDEERKSLNQDSARRAKSRRKPSMLQKASEQERRMKYNQDSGNNMNRSAGFVLRKCHSPVISEPDIILKISEVEGVYSPKIDHLFPQSPEEDLLEFPVGYRREIPKFFKPNNSDLKKL
ncbi:unnamed protein product [Moneuplotes crassus]|uniref:Casein kinase I n=1 Tax=Euplotes crassus TaxID=5936 RepID=A0AAD1Y5V5_EUPCR|nr:unnamed protein product [Moneuplotes crassus]